VDAADRIVEIARACPASDVGRQRLLPAVADLPGAEERARPDTNPHGGQAEKRPPAPTDFRELSHPHAPPTACARTGCGNPLSASSPRSTKARPPHSSTPDDETSVWPGSGCMQSRAASCTVEPKKSPLRSIGTP